MLTNDIQTVSPAFDKNNIPVVFATDNNFVPYLGVTIKSLVENSSEDNNYDIVILYSNVDEYNRKRLKSLEQKNVSIRFYDMTDLMEEYKDDWYVHSNWSDAVYYRFYIPQIFINYSKVVFLDADTIIKFDISELFNMDIGTNQLAAVQDIPRMQDNDFHSQFIKEKLEIKCCQYFNAGVLVFNLKYINNKTFLEHSMEALKKLENPFFQDQDVFNYIFKNNVYYLDNSYNTSWNCVHFWTNCRENLPKEIYAKYHLSLMKPKIIHYAGAYKPWKQPWLAFSEHFWYYARQTIFYEEIIYKNTKNNSSRTIVRNAINRRKIYLQYLRCKLLKLLTFGNTRKHYKEKIDKYKKIVKDYRKTLNG